MFGIAWSAQTAWAFRGHHPKPELKEILERMNDRGKHLKTISANLDYTKVTVVVNDKETESGQFFLRKGKDMEIMIHFTKPDVKEILIKKKTAQIYLPKTNQIQEYDLSQHADLLQQFLLLGFGTDADRLKKDYSIKVTGEEDLEGDTVAVLELTPLNESIAAQLTKIELWVSEESWLPAQQKFYEASGDYLLVHYTSVRVDRHLDSSTFHISAKAKKVNEN
jgi:outer membrane lipoprotein-sorting protein